MGRVQQYVSENITKGPEIWNQLYLNFDPSVQVPPKRNEKPREIATLQTSRDQDQLINRQFPPILLLPTVRGSSRRLEVPIIL